MASAMKKFKDTFFYVGVTVACVAVIYWVVLLGAKMEQGRDIVSPIATKGQWSEFIDSLVHNLEHPLAILLAQIVTILITARFFGWLCKRIGQPSVIGEITAGIILGPSLMGMYFPEFSATIFPAESLGNLEFLSQIGLIMFMFVVGMELDLNVMRSRARDVVIIGQASIALPFTLGIGLAYFIYESFAPKGVSFLSFSLFIGIAMSITAFPVLARIVQERAIHKSKLGVMVLAAAAANDIVGWSMLAMVIAIVKAGSVVSALYVIGMSILYVFLMIKVVRPFLRRVGDLHSSREKLSKPIVAIFLLTLIISSYATEVIGIHALFGAFMAGTIMPENVKFRSIFIEKVEDVSLILLLPLFFVFTGLHTDIGLLNDWYLWKITGLVILVATAGKFIGSAIASRFAGHNWQDSLTVGALMNTRGLMELIVLNIGYNLGVLDEKLFAMLVIMALVTTFTTGPALDLINWIFKSRVAKVPTKLKKIEKFKILISFGNPDRGKSLLRLANGLVKNEQAESSITAMHLTPSNEIHQYNIQEYEKESFAPVVRESKKLEQKITTLFKASNDIDSDITEVANNGNYNLLLIGVGRSIFEGSLLGKILGFTTRIINPDRLLSQVTGKEGLFENSPFDEGTRSILSKSDIPVGIFLDKELKGTDTIFVPIFSEKDAALLKYAQKLVANSDSKVSILDAEGHIQYFPELREAVKELEESSDGKVKVLTSQAIEKEFLVDQNLMLLSFESWKKLVDTKSLWLSDIPSTLIIAEK